MPEPVEVHEEIPTDRLLPGDIIKVIYPLRGCTRDCYIRGVYQPMSSTDPTKHIIDTSAYHAPECPHAGPEERGN